MRKVSPNILDRINSIIKKYSLFTNDEAVVAYSGGKDSLFLCFCLMELGFKVIPVIIDIGYNVNWNKAVDNINSIGLSPCLLSVNSSSEISLETKESVKDYFGIVQDIKEGKHPGVSPCTPCYNAKIKVLADWADQKGISCIAMGHHGTDAIASMLKSYFMYYDRWKEGHISYDYNNYLEVIRNHKSVFQMDEQDFINSGFYADVQEQIKLRNAGTDEPIIQKNESSIEICRPLYDIMEYEIFEYYKGYAIEFCTTECFRTGYRTENVLTPREMVQYILLRNTKPDILSHLMKLNYSCIDDKGHLIFRVRNNREKILGPFYKSSVNSNKI